MIIMMTGMMKGNSTRACVDSRDEVDEIIMLAPNAQMNVELEIVSQLTLFPMVLPLVCAIG